MEALVTMVETRATLSACRPLEILEPCSKLSRLPRDTRRRLVRALLPSVTEMAFPWDKAYDEDVRIHGAPHLKTLDVTNAQTLSAQVLEAMPLLEDLAIIAPKDTHEHVAALEPFLAALNRRIAFQQLRHLELCHFLLEDTKWDQLLSTLAEAPCAEQLTSLTFRRRDFGPPSMASFSALLRQDRFPALQQLWLQSDFNMEDEEAVLLAEGLPAHVTDLELRCIGMDDALASIVRTGRFHCLETLWLGSNEDVTDQGLVALAKALDHVGKNGLSMLSTFSASLWPPATRVGIEALAHAHRIAQINGRRHPIPFHPHRPPRPPHLHPPPLDP